MPIDASAAAQARTRRPKSSVETGRQAPPTFWRKRSGRGKRSMPRVNTSASVAGSWSMGRVYHERVARRKGSLYHERVRKILPVLLLPALAGCIFGSGEASRVERVPEELRRPRLVAPRVFDRHAYGDVTKVRAGQWANYEEGGRRITLAAVAAAGDAMWIEVIEEGEPRQVSARLVGP